jgi:hypothetical protein
MRRAARQRAKSVARRVKAINLSKLQVQKIISRSKDEWPRSFRSFGGIVLNGVVPDLRSFWSFGASEGLLRFHPRAFRAFDRRWRWSFRLLVPAVMGLSSLLVAVAAVSFMESWCGSSTWSLPLSWRSLFSCRVSPRMEVSSSRSWRRRIMSSPGSRRRMRYCHGS